MAAQPPELPMRHVIQLRLGLYRNRLAAGRAYLHELRVHDIFPGPDSSSGPAWRGSWGPINPMQQGYAARMQKSQHRSAWRRQQTTPGSVRKALTPTGRTQLLNLSPAVSTPLRRRWVDENSAQLNTRMSIHSDTGSPFVLRNAGPAAALRGGLAPLAGLDVP